MKSTFRKSHHGEMNFELQITALIDTLVIILIFLLKSISVDTLELDPVKDLKMPTLNQGVSTGKGDKISIRADGILYGTEVIVTLADFKPVAGSEEQWKNLQAKLAESRKLASEAAGDKKPETAFFLEADKSAPLSVVSRAMQMLTSNGYTNVRFIGARYN